MFEAKPLILWGKAFAEKADADRVIADECDPWHMVSAASAIFVDEGDEARIIAALAGVPCHVRDGQGALALCDGDPARLLAAADVWVRFENPFTGEPMDAGEAVELCGFWRRMIDSNRDLSGGIGFAFWKQGHVAPLLWDGSGPFKFLRSAREAAAGGSAAIWRSKAMPQALSELARRKVRLVEVEDGFLRSQGLGADCIPPLSLTVDRLGAHFDPAGPSDLENILQHGRFDLETLSRAQALRQLIVDSGLGKYESGLSSIERPGGARRHILVPGQVEDDRAVQCGGCGLTSNLELLKRVRADAPDAYVLYKPHPDVLAGHRRGAISNNLCLQYADEVVGKGSMASLIAMVDEVHVNTSLAGFEALLRGRPVTTHGVPFYAGWGLTRDLGPVPDRRTAHRTIDELVAATLLIYPRYLDPVTGLPCPAEIVAARLSCDETSNTRMIVGVRRLQGKFMRGIRSLVQ